MRKAAQRGERRTDSPENTHGTKHMNSCTFKAHLLPNDTKCVYTFTICWDHVRQEVINTEQHLVVRCFKVDLSLHKYSICEPIIQAAAVLLIDIRSFAVTLLPTLRYDWISMFDIFSLPASLIVSPSLIFIDPTEAVFMLGWLSCSSYHSTAVTSPWWPTLVKLVLKYHTPHVWNSLNQILYSSTLNVNCNGFITFIFVSNIFIIVKTTNHDLYQNVLKGALCSFA